MSKINRFDKACKSKRLAWTSPRVTHTPPSAPNLHSFQPPAGCLSSYNCCCKCSNGFGLKRTRPKVKLLVCNEWPNCKLSQTSHIYHHLHACQISYILNYQCIKTTNIFWKKEPADIEEKQSSEIHLINNNALGVFVVDIEKQSADIFVWFFMSTFASLFISCHKLLWLVLPKKDAIDNTIDQMII